MHAGVMTCWHAWHAVVAQVRQYQSWSLMPFAVAIGTVYPAAYMRGARETFNSMEPNFPRCLCCCCWCCCCCCWVAHMRPWHACAPEYLVACVGTAAAAAGWRTCALGMRVHQRPGGQQMEACSTKCGAILVIYTDIALWPSPIPR